MTHVFVAPHPDDAALSCGGLIASLREVGQSVTILTVYSGGADGSLASNEVQREALGFGTKTLWPDSQAFNRSNIASEYPVPVTSGAPWQADPARVEATQERANTQARQFWQRAAWTRSANVTNEVHDGRPLRDDLPTQGTLATYDLSVADRAAIRRAEDERYAWFIEAALVQLDLADAVHRGYEGDDALLGEPAPDDEPPVDLLRREILRLEPQHVYLPAAIGGHVDHRLCRDAGLALLAEPPAWVMPGPSLIGRLSLYEDFPYAWWSGRSGREALEEQGVVLPEGVTLEARYADISDQLERKSAGLRVYASQMPLLFDDEQRMLDAVAGFAARTAQEGGVGSGAAERYWGVVSS
jgi:LmbE family N-acetylglucosaminyl deacetylase